MRQIVIGLAAALSLGTTGAFAAQLTGNYSVSEYYSTANGGPSIAYDLADPFKANLTVGVKTTPTDFFTANPAGRCSGPGCSNNIATDQLTVRFTGLTVEGVTIPNFSVTAGYIASYSGAELACAVGDGKSPKVGATDCIIWSGAANTYNGSITSSHDLGNGDTLDIFLYNATDWSITPQIALELVKNTNVPEPASLGLMAAGLAGLGLIRRRRQTA